jgi:hypothetical protein
MYAYIYICYSDNKKIKYILIRIKIIFIVSKIMRNGNIKCRSKRSSSKFDYAKLPNNYLRIRVFSSTPLKRSDPMGAALVVVTSHGSTLINTTIANTFVLLIGMATALFNITGPFINFISDPTLLVSGLDDLSHLLRIYQRFLQLEINLINLLISHLGSLTEEQLIIFYIMLQEFVTTRESLYSALDNVITSLDRNSLGLEINNRINGIM